LRGVFEYMGTTFQILKDTILPVHTLLLSGPVCSTSSSTRLLRYPHRLWSGPKSQSKIPRTLCLVFGSLAVLYLLTATWSSSLTNIFSRRPSPNQVSHFSAWWKCLSLYDGFCSVQFSSVILWRPGNLRLGCVWPGKCDNYELKFLG